MRAILPISAFCFLLSAFPAAAAYYYASGAAGESYSPTNNGVQNNSWWVADGQVLTNASGQLSNWVDSGVSPRNLTNIAVDTKWPYVSNNIVNGHAAVHFVRANNTYLRAASYTNPQPHEIVMVVRYIEPTNGTTAYIFDSANASKRNALFQSNAGKLVAYAGGSAGTIPFTTNKWFVLDILYSGSSSAIFTNNGSTGTINPSTGVADGFTIGSDAGGGLGAPIQVAEIVTYATSLGAVDSAGTYSVASARSNLFVYLTNKYGITP